MEEFTGRRPNRMALGVNVYNALKKHPAILERVKYSGSTANPAMVNANVLSQLFEMERLSVQRSIMNNAALGEEAKCSISAIRTHSCWHTLQIHRQ